MLSLFSLPFAVPLQLLKLSASATTPTVSLSYGTFEGFNSGNLTQFLGVPFAQAARGRFEYPQEPDVLHGVQKATAYGPACPQQKVSHPPGLPFEVATYADISEDCQLALSLMLSFLFFVWIYGGGFAIGHSRDFNLTPVVERSIEIGQPFIAVTINYRLNAFGWLMGKEAAAAGINNLGLRDQIFVLEWVQRNIELFQGDPERVSVGGQSAGGVSTAFLAFDNAQDSNTLFKGAWLQSGPPFHIPHLLDDQDIYDALIDATNCSSSPSSSSVTSGNAIECLRTVPLETLISAVNVAPNFLSYRAANSVWMPRIDGELILGDPWVSVMRGKYAKIPIVAGVCEDEGTLFALASLNITTDAEFSGYVHSNYFPKTSSSEMAELARLYPRDPAQGSPFGTGTEFQLSPQYKRVAAFTGDMFVTSPLRFFTQHASARQDVWGWSVTANKAAGGAAGAFHGIDTAVWMTKTTVLGTQGMDRMVNFVNNLNPNDPATPTAWPKHNSSSSSSLMVFADDGVSIAADDYRREAVNYLNYLRVKEA